MSDIYAEAVKTLESEIESRDVTIRRLQGERTRLWDQVAKLERNLERASLSSQQGGAGPPRNFLNPRLDMVDGATSPFANSDGFFGGEGSGDSSWDDFQMSARKDTIDFGVQCEIVQSANVGAQCQLIHAAVGPAEASKEPYQPRKRPPPIRPQSDGGSSQGRRGTGSKTPNILSRNVNRSIRQSPRNISPPVYSFRNQNGTPNENGTPNGLSEYDAMVQANREKLRAKQSQTPTRSCRSVSRHTCSIHSHT